MPQGYYSLQEAARFLGMPPDELKQMAQKNAIRSFQDRGTLRFRIPDIQELARQRGLTSDPELKLGEAPVTPRAPKPGDSQRSPAAKKSVPEVFDFALDPGEDVGRNVLADSPSQAKKGPKSDPKKGRSPTPKPGSDSDVKLVAEGDLAITLGGDSDVKLVSGDSNVKVAQTPSPVRPSKLGASPKPKRPSQLSPSPVQTSDSGVRLVPMDSDSDVKIIGARDEEISIAPQRPSSPTDSDIRLERQAPQPPASDEGMMLTEEINLDEEIKKQEAARKPTPQAKVKPKSKVKFPTTSPFELSESDLHEPKTPKKPPSSSDIELKPGQKPPSSDFDLSADSSGSLVLEPDSSEFTLDLSGEGPLQGPSSGINLAHPDDAGISLEETEGSDVDFELSLDAEGATPKPAPAKEAPDSDSEFELSLDADDSAQTPSSDSDSEFELTLDDSGESSAINLTPQAKSSKQEKDIFETDFEVPALEEDSGSQVAALDTDLDSSDFDIALDEAADQESGSQVVALDEEEVDEGAATVAARRPAKGAKVKGFTGLDLDEEPAEDVEIETEPSGPVREVVREKLIEAAPWGPLPVIFMLPCVIVMFVVGLMGFELIQAAAGYKEPGLLTRTIAELIGQKVR